VYLQANSNHVADGQSFERHTTPAQINSGGNPVALYGDFTVGAVK